MSMPEHSPKRRRARKKVRPLRFLFATILLLGLLVGAGGIGYTAFIIKDVPAFDAAKFQSSESSIIYDKDGNEIAKIHGAENRTYIRIDEVPDLVKKAFLATEDNNFYDHHGVDPRGLARAVWSAAKGQYGSVGGSTITQQLVKLTMLTNEKSLERKVKEMYLALKLERMYSKDEILEMYLNRIYFGQNSYGIKAAAEFYFGKEVADLTVAEMAMLAGIPQRPNSLSPLIDPQAAKIRRSHVLNNMWEFGYITASERQEANADTFESLVHDEQASTEDDSYPYQYFVEYVQEQLEEMYGPSKVFEGGLRVYTTLDPKIQEATETVLADEDNFPKSQQDKNGNLQPQAAAVVMEPGTGYIRAIVGGRGNNSGSKRILNRASQSLRQPGSALKPIIAYGPALEEAEMGTGTIINDAPVKYGSYEPKNSGGGYSGPVTLRYALRKSINIVAIKLLDEVGIAKAKKFASKLGITTLDSKHDAGLGIALGGIYRGVSPLEMTAAYAAIANNGVYVQPVAITKVTDSSNNVLDEIIPKKTVAMKPSTAYMLTDMLKTAVDYGTATRAKIKGWHVSGKTGTTNDAKDVWFAGFTSKYAAVVWLGHDQPKAMPGEFGGRYPTQIWHKIMTQALEGLEDEGFEKPDNIISVRVCSESGKRATDQCPSDTVRSELFVKGTSPTGYCDIHSKTEVCAETGQLPNEYCPDVVTKAFAKDEVPTETCTLHNADNITTVSICTDPRHNGTDVVANIGANGGCPADMIKSKAFTKGKEPKAVCTLPDHTLTPGGVDQPELPSDTTVEQPPTPVEPYVNRPTKNSKSKKSSVQSPWLPQYEPDR